MQDDLPEIDEAGLRKIARIERALRKLYPDDIGAFISITNALEYHVERAPPHAETVRLLAQAPRGVRGITRHRRDRRRLRNTARGHASLRPVAWVHSLGNQILGV